MTARTVQDFLFSVSAPLSKFPKFRFGGNFARSLAAASLLLLPAGTSDLQAQAAAAPSAASSAAPATGAAQGTSQTATPSSASQFALPSAQTSGAGNRNGSQNGRSATGTGADRGGTDANRAGDTTEMRNGPAADTRPAITQFQQLVSTSTGSLLPIFGSSLFSSVPTTFAPVTNVPVTADYLIGPGDELNLQLSGQVNQGYDLTVDRSGNIDVPELGTVHVTGVPFSQLNTYLKAQLGRIYRNFALNTTLGSLRTVQVFVVGEAVRPGSYTVSSLSTLLNAVFASGGPLPDGSLRDIQVKRNGETIVHFDLYDLLLRGDKHNDIRLLSGDVIFIPFVGPQIAIAGSVNAPAIYELKGATTIDEALKLAGGETAVASGGALRLERVYEHSMRSIEDIDLATAGAQTLRNGDILSVSSILERFRNAVTLRGNVANPGRYVWHPGLRISDLIPNKASLITRNYWSRQNEQGQLQQDYAPGTNASTAGQGALGAGSEAPGSPSNSGPAGSPAANSGGNGGTQAGGNSVGAALNGSNPTFSARTDLILSAPDIDWSYAVIERLNAGDLKTSLIPFALGKLVLSGDASQNLELLPNDIVTIFSTADIRVPSSQQTRYVRLEGEFLAPGIYSVLPGETLRGLLRRAGAFTPDAYLYASSFTRLSTRRVEGQRLQEYADQLQAQIASTGATANAQAVTAADQTAANASTIAARTAVARLRTTVPSGRLVLDLKPNSIGVDALPDLALEDGDRFLVPRVPDAITVQGQVYNPNAFVYAPRQIVQDYLRRAGGPDRQADRRREFILRADGSVVSEQYANVHRAPVFPGDTIVVPPTLDRRTRFQRILDAVALVNNFGLSAGTLYLLAR